MALVTQAAGILEEDKNGDVMWTWLYPIISAKHKQYIVSKCGCGRKDFLPFVFVRFDNLWFYIITHTTGEKSILSQVEKFAVALIATDFCPEKYSALLKLFAAQYNLTGNPVSLLEQYLKVFTQGVCRSNSNGVFKTSDFDPLKSLQNVSLKDVVQTCGIQSILIYTCVLLKKRVVLYHSDLEKLLHLTRAIPSFAIHRADWSILYPWVTNDKEEVDDVTKQHYYVMGTTDASLGSNEDIYDIYVDLTSGDIQVASHSKDTFAMSKTHKDIANAMMEVAQDAGSSNAKLIKRLETKTNEVIGKLRTLGGDSGHVDLEDIKSLKLNQATENFLNGLGRAEKLIQAT